MIKILDEILKLYSYPKFSKDIRNEMRYEENWIQIFGRQEKYARNEKSERLVGIRKVLICLWLVERMIIRILWHLRKIWKKFEYKLKIIEKYLPRKRKLNRNFRKNDENE